MPVLGAAASISSTPRHRKEAAEHGGGAEGERPQRVESRPAAALTLRHTVHGHGVQHGVASVQASEAHEVTAAGEEHGRLEEATAVDAQGGHGGAS